MLDMLTLSASQRASLTEAADLYHQNVDTLASYLEPRGISKAAAYGARLGLVSEPAYGHERFTGWMSIPYLTEGGVVAIKFRCMVDHDHKAMGHGKYDGPGGQQIRLYNAQVCAVGGPLVLILEGELDPLVAQYGLDIPAVGTWGTNWMDWYPRCFSDFDRKVVVADNDIAKVIKGKDDQTPVSIGVKHAKKVQATISGAELVLPPLGMDLGEWFVQEGREPIREALGL
jgi:hypothetical protein